jgi:hypothetical protein
MNPQTIMGMVMSFMGMGTTMVNQGAIIHRELHPPQQAQTLQQQCIPPRFKLEVIITQSGQRQLVCTEVPNAQ